VRRGIICGMAERMRQGVNPLWTPPDALTPFGVIVMTESEIIRLEILSIATELKTVREANYTWLDRAEEIHRLIDESIMLYHDWRKLNRTPWKPSGP
jgi:hypothetical protein